MTCELCGGDAEFRYGWHEDCSPMGRVVALCHTCSLVLIEPLHVVQLVTHTIGSWIVAWGEELRRCTAWATRYDGSRVEDGRCELRAGHAETVHEARRGQLLWRSLERRP